MASGVHTSLLRGKISVIKGEKRKKALNTNDTFMTKEIEKKL